MGSSPRSWGSFFREVRGGAGARGVFFLEGFFLFFGCTCGIADCDLRALSYPTRNRTCATCSGNQNPGFPGSSAGKESAYSAEDLGLIPGWGRSSAGEHGNPLQYSCLENPHGQRSLAGYSPWGCKESDRTELLRTAQHSTWSSVGLPRWC